LVKEVRARLDLAGHSRVGIYVSGGMDAERIGQMVEAGAPVDSFGVGMAISAAPPIGFTADIKEVAGEPRTKRGRIPGMQAAPRLEKIR
jgi:nicotinate phosphoribosyltransferase